MQYLSFLPEVSSIGVEGDIIELELEQEIKELPELGDDDPVVLTARYAGQIIVAVGRVIEHENTGGPGRGSQSYWCRMKMKGSSVTFTI